MIVKAKDFREGFYKLNRYLFENDAYDWVRGQVTAHKFHVEVSFETAICDLEMKDINYTPSKWKQLIRLYLNVEELGNLCARLLFYKAKKGKHLKYLPDIGMNFKARKNASGACLMAFTMGYNQTQGWHAEVFTRASELTMRWYMDLIFVHVLIREIGKIVGFTPKDCRVNWHMVSAYQSITSIPLFVIMDGKEDWLLKHTPENMSMDAKNTENLPEWQWGTIRRYHKCFTNDGYSNFRVQRRPQEAYKIMKGEIPPKKNILTKDLTLPEINYNRDINEEVEDD